MTQEKLIRVRDIMKQHFDMVDRMQTVAEALQEMRYHETKCLIVDKAHDNDEYGVLLIADIAKKVLAKDRAPERVNVYEIMRKPTISIDPEMDIRYAARLFNQFKISRTPVIENRKIIGIVSLTDMVLRGLCGIVRNDIPG